MTDNDRDDIVAERGEANIADVLERGPGLRWNRSTWIVGRDRAKGMIYLGGLGGMGVGRMWIEERFEKIHSDGSRSAPDSEDPTYADAPDMVYVEHPFDVG